MCSDNLYCIYILYRSKGVSVHISDRDNLVATDVGKADIVIAAGGEGGREGKGQ